MRTTKNLLAAAVLTLALAAGASAQESKSSLPSIARAIAQAQGTGALTQGDASRGLKDALALSVDAVTTRLGRQDGFFGDPRIKIPLPGVLGKAQKALQPLGMAAPLDDLQLRVNRGAEAAMPQAKKLFLDAVRSMTVEDAVAIVRGPDNAATQFLRQKSETQLTTLLKPKMEQALAQAGAFTALEGAAARAGANGATASQSLKADLVNFAVAKALDGAFGYVADEERAIRQDPARRTTAILKRVFGGG